MCVKLLEPTEFTFLARINQIKNEINLLDRKNNIIQIKTKDDPTLISKIFLQDTLSENIRVALNSKIMDKFRQSYRTNTFIQKLDEFLYINANAVKFFRKNIFSRETLLTFLKLIFISVENDYENLVMFFNLSSKNFVTTFKFLGSEYYNFLILLSKMAFSHEYFKFNNYFFITDVLSRTLNLPQEMNKRQQHVVKELSDFELNQEIDERTTAKNKEELKKTELMLEDLKKRNGAEFLNKESNLKILREKKDIYADCLEFGDKFKNLYYFGKVLMIIRESSNVMNIEYEEIYLLYKGIKDMLDKFDYSIVINFI